MLLQGAPGRNGTGYRRRSWSSAAHRTVGMIVAAVTYESAEKGSTRWLHTEISLRVMPYAILSRRTSCFPMRASSWSAGIAILIQTRAGRDRW